MVSAGRRTTFSSSTSATMPTMRRGSGLPKSASVHHTFRFTASPLGNSRCATLWLMMATGSASRRSSSVNSRPATSGTPSTEKKPGATIRMRACGFSSPSAGVYPSTANWNPAPNVPASRHGT